MSEMDYTYEERQNRDGNLYDTPINESVAAEVVTELTSDADYLEALSDKFSGDAEYLAGVVAALTADAPYLAAIGAALAVDAVFLAGVSGELDHSVPLDTASFTQDSEGDAGADKITVTIQLEDADAGDWAQRTMLSIWACSDADCFTPAAVDSIAAGTNGGLLEELTAATSYTAVTDETGLLDVVVEKTGGVATIYLGVMLPNGKYVPSGAVTFA